ncbi:permease prefix domain 1-containing protein [Halobacillus sp. A1]|uniref:permease prefix domain 1-containing protein n=1 Tax=Halobacillus sp. A1 TaxID=2880262 RepID=UPI0020A68987|nr:permease prefix domain 1-containing protein [Halobacillus sp. A1]MCP3033082.1 permease prefix domain 1-containing protein [Halobacillus sp. A1]
MNRMEKHVKKILDHMQSPPEERQEIKDELMAHLEEAKQQHIKQGASEKKAELLAIKEFGNPGLIGNGLQESLYPYQRALLYIIGIAVLVFGALFYISMTFALGEAEPIWLLVQMSIGSAITLSAINIAFMGRHYWSLNVLVLIAAMWNGFNGILAEQIPGRQAIFFWGYLVLLILLCILFVIRNSYYSSDPNTTKQTRNMIKVSYVVNIIFGVMICAAALFFTYGFMIFAGFTWILMVPLSSSIAWLIFFKFQMKLIHRHPMGAIAVGFGFLVFASVSPFAILSAI